MKRSNDETAEPPKRSKSLDADSEFVQRAINTVRVLSADMVEKANSGHPGAPMGCAPMGKFQMNLIIYSLTQIFAYS